MLGYAVVTVIENHGELILPHRYCKGICAQIEGSS